MVDHVHNPDERSVIDFPVGGMCGWPGARNLASVFGIDGQR